MAESHRRFRLVGKLGGRVVAVGDVSVRTACRLNEWIAELRLSRYSPQLCTIPDRRVTLLVIAGDAGVHPGWPRGLEAPALPNSTQQSNDISVATVGDERAAAIRQCPGRVAAGHYHRGYREPVRVRSAVTGKSRKHGNGGKHRNNNEQGSATRHNVPPVRVLRTCSQGLAPGELSSGTTLS